MNSKQLKKLHEDQLASQLVVELHTIENEQSILGSLLLASPESIAIQKLKGNQITQTNFVSASHKIIFAQIHKFFVTKKNQNTIDTLEISKDIALKYSEIYKDGYSEIVKYLLVCVSKTNLTSSLENSISEAKENYQKSLLAEIKKVDFNKMEVLESVAYLQNVVKEIDSQTIVDKPFNGEDLMTHYISEIEERNSQESIELPFDAFKTAGVVFGSSNLVSVAGSPKAGKTSFALQTALEFAKSNKNVLFFTLELSIVEMVEKSLAYFGTCNPVIIKNIHLPKNQDNHTKRWSDACKVLFNDLKDNISFIGDKKFSIWEICQTIRESNKASKLDFVYIDQLSFIHTNNMFGMEKHKEYDYIVRELKELCKELKICIVLLAQLNRGASGEDIDYADIQHIKDSSAVAETSDILILAKRNEKQAKMNNKRIQVNFTVVSRHSKGGLVALDWNTLLARFEDEEIPNLPTKK